MRSSKNYVMTAYVESASDMLELERIRKVVRTINKELRKKAGDSPSGSCQQFYVKCQGRGPRTLPSLRDGRGGRGYDSFFPLRHATRMDVYVYEKYDYTKKEKLFEDLLDAGYAS